MIKEKINYNQKIKVRKGNLHIYKKGIVTQKFLLGILPIPFTKNIMIAEIK